jgi:spore coat protein U-like protein
MAGSGGGFLTYEIYSDSNHTAVWGTGADELALAVAPSIAERSFTTYGRMPAAQDVPEGNYVDTITVTVTY